MNVETDSARVVKLHKLFDSVLRGSRTLSGPRDGCLFLDAICCEEDVSSCVHKLISSDEGLSALRKSVLFDTSTEFLNGKASMLLRYLQDPALPNISGGIFLQRIILSIVEPPFFWDALISNFQSGNLDELASQSLAWLVLGLISLPDAQGLKFRAFVKKSGLDAQFLKSSELDIRQLAQKIKHILSIHEDNASDFEENGPGGRHDNDFQSISDIAIMPTPDEILASEKSFIRLAEAIEETPMGPSRVRMFLDNQFRLLREDMLGEIREELGKIMDIKKAGYHRGITIDGLVFAGIDCDETKRAQPWTMRFRRNTPLSSLGKLTPAKRSEFLEKNKNFLKHNSLACLIADGDLIGFPALRRDDELLAADGATIVVQILGGATFSRLLSKIKSTESFKLVQLDTSVFAYEPVLQRLQKIKEFSLSEELLCWHEDFQLLRPPCYLEGIIERLEELSGQDIRALLGITKGREIKLDKSQAKSLISALSTRLSLIQGPPGTGKSFIGALIAKIIHDRSSQTILVVCYTNHALDQFLADLLDIGIPQQSMIRLGGKSTDRTKPLTLREQNNRHKTSYAVWQCINELEDKQLALRMRLKETFRRYESTNMQNGQLMDYLEFLEDERPFFDAFSVPTSTDGMTQVGKKNKKIDKFFILNRWNRGALDSGIRSEIEVIQYPQIWELSLEQRQVLLKTWKSAILEDINSELCQIFQGLEENRKELDRLLGLRNTELIKDKRIIACTTTGAAMFTADVQAAKPEVLLVEEAGEILESHIITSLAPETRQMVLIGDHQQLRPKVNNYGLSVEKGDGYDLNMSTFERLVKKGYPHHTLTQQHRMRPEISRLVRELTYPDLVDAKTTKGRPDLRGFSDNVIFVNHDHAEEEDGRIKDRQEVTSSSKKNVYEAEMVLKTVRYLAQQGYGSEDIVVLTPYLGQLKMLKEILEKENDPILNDLDASDLSRAGLLGTVAVASSKKRSVHLSTIDNYQGEESNIVVVSMTRCNKTNDIGFMSAPQRLNVLLSRARNAMIMFGSAETFKKARKGSDTYGKFFEIMNGAGHMYGGLPIKCEIHPDRNALLYRASDFESECPDGGCNQPCGSTMNCGLHKCPSKCHQIHDHSKVLCKEILALKCPNGHDQKWECHDSAPLSCHKCDQEEKDRKKKQMKAFEEQKRRERDQKEHVRRMADLEEQIERVKQDQKDAKLDEDRRKALDQKAKDLADAKQQFIASLRAVAKQQHISQAVDTNMQTKSTSKVADPSAKATSHASSSSSRVINTTEVSVHQPLKESPANIEWQRQKDVDNASNTAIDDIMEMTGLEAVKTQVLKIKAKVDTCIRQNSGLHDERFGVVLLGNPGTGKTTVARHYAKFLASMNVLPGDEFIETTGSRLAHGGVAEIKKHVEKLLAGEGGVIFVDEAYQLVEAHNPGGKSVLDFMLAEIENQIGKIVFILAGYTKQMEKFFEHNPGLPSRIPYKLLFEDYEDDELLHMLRRLIDKKYNGKMKIEGGGGGLYMRILIRRLGRGRGREGFGNARALEILFAKMRERQAYRLQLERRDGLKPDDYLTIKEDLIGPDPSEAIIRSKAWDSLQGLTGLSSVKQSVQSSIDMIGANYQRELREEKPVETSLNRVFLGSPGTGKTTVAKLYGQILVDLGLLSNGEVIVKNPADFIGNVIGQSEANTKAILASTIGKVLVIDEAYMLYQDHGGSGGQVDIYRTAVVDTIVAEVQSVIGEDRCVLLLGYEDKMRKMFQNVNEGLSRRFPLDDAFVFADFEDSDLEKILQQKLKKQGLGATPAAVSVAIGILRRKRDGLNFGNAGEVENLISKAKMSYQRRQSIKPVHLRSTDFLFRPEDFDADFERALSASENLQKLFEGVIGCEAIVEKLSRYQRTAQGMKAQGLEPCGHIPMSFIFKGPPGTGKTTTARKIGQVYYDMGLISQVEVVECSAKDLIGEYIGHTAPKTAKQLELGLGKVLFIDEAYRLGEGHFATEAANELVDLMTKTKFMGKMIIILAGYDEDMDKLMLVNRGLSSRFSEEIYFPALDAEQSLSLLETELKKKDIYFDYTDKEDKAAIKDIIEVLAQLTCLQSWGNARDVQTLGKTMMGKLFADLTEKSDRLKLQSSVALSVLEEMLARRLKTEGNISQVAQRAGPPMRTKSLNPAPPQAPTSSTNTAPKVDHSPSQPSPEDDQASEKENDKNDSAEARDDGVSDEIWTQLLCDKQAAEAANDLRDQEIAKLDQEAKAVESQRRALRKAEEANRAQRDEIKRQLEEERIAKLHQKLSRERAEAELERARNRVQEELQREKKAQQKLSQMGVCVAGFRWIKQSGGYRCAGGAHFVDDAAIERMIS